MTTVWIRKILGGTAAVLGTVWLGMIVFQVGRMAWTFWQDGATTAWIGVAAGILFFSLFAIPGALAVFFGMRLFREMRISWTRWVVGLLSTGAAFLVEAALPLSPLAAPHVPERIQSMASLLGISLLAVAFYFYTLRLLLPRLGVPRPKLSSLISRGALVFLTWELWFVLNAVTDEYFGRLSVTEPHNSWRELLTLLVPAIIAYGTFRLAASRLSSPMPELLDAEPAWRTNIP